MTNVRVARVGALATAPLIALWLWSPRAQTASSNHKTIATEAEFHQAMKDLSNWGRWGADDELGAANLITPAKRRRAAALVKGGITVSLEHPIFQEEVVDGRGHLQRTFNGRPTGASDTYAFSSTYHGSIFSHLDALDCHMLEDGKGYNGRSWEDAQKAGGCPKGDIMALKDGIVTRAVLFDATLLPGKAPKGWLEPGTAVHYDDLEALERIEKVKVSEGDIILLHTGRWKRRAELGPWKTSEGVAGYHADVAFFLKERGVSFIGADEWNDVSPTTLPQSVGLPIHKLALVALGVDIFDNLDLERVSETAKRLGRYEFLFTAAPLQIEKGTGSPLNPVAVF